MYIKYQDKMYKLHEKKVIGDKPRTMKFEIYAEDPNIKVAEYPDYLWFDLHAIHGEVTEDLLVEVLYYDISASFAKHFGHEVPVNPFVAPKSMRVVKNETGEHVVEYAY